ncbi:MAG: hypothetical protein GC160_07310 [Acidobacteria bacterium]|nr:hypothetical protein [Acidobacteriota bacterium]
MQRYFAIILACALAALPASAAPALGGLTTAGAVWSNQVALPSGSTIYAGDVIETGADALAVLSSPSKGRVEIRAESKASLSDDAVTLSSGVVAADRATVRLGDLSVAAKDAAGDNWFVVSDRDGEKLIAAYRGDVVVRGQDGAFTVPAGSFALAAAALPPSPQTTDKDKKDHDDDDKAGGAIKRAPRTAGRAAGAGAKSGWSIGSLGHWASVAVVTGGTAAAITGTVVALDDTPASPQD